METIDSAHTSAEEPTTRAWQFSLREIVLATVALAAVLAVVMQNQPRRISSMARQFDPPAAVTRIMKDNSLPGQAFKAAGSGGGKSDSMVRLNFKIMLRGVPISDVKGVLMPALMDEIQTAITAEGYSIKSSGKSGNRNKVTQEWDELSSFSFGYAGLKISGLLRVFTCYDRSGDPMLIITLDED